MDNRLKAATDNALQQLITALEAGHSQTLKAYLTSMAKFHKYSWNNCLLIFCQKPDASLVAGFKKWESMGRWVKRGERGIMIIAPQFYKKKIEGQSESESTNDETIARFTSAWVWDISQTDGEPLPEIDQVKGDPKCHLLSLRDHVAELGIALVFDDLKHANGLSHGGKITIRKGLTAAEEFSVLVHELAHEMLHRTERRKQTTKAIRELEAEAVSFVVCSAINLETNNAAADYIQLWGGDKEALMSSLSFIQHASSQILAAIL